MVQQILVFRSLNFLKEPHIVASKIVFTKSWAFPGEGLLHFLTDFQGRGFVKKRNIALFLFRSKFENFPLY